MGCEDWIKMRVNLAEEPEVIQMAAQLKIDEERIVGKLHRFWSWVDQHLMDGNAPGVTKKWLDRYMSVTGWSEALAEAGWLTLDGAGFKIPNYEEHLSKSAKRRAVTAKRLRRHREKKSNAPSVTKALLEKEKEKDIKPPTPLPAILDTKRFRTAWALWMKYLKQKKKAPTPLTVTRQITKLTRMGLDGALDAIEQSITNGWVGLFEPKDGNNRPDPPERPRGHLSLYDNLEPDLRVEN